MEAERYDSKRGAQEALAEARGRRTCDSHFPPTVIHTFTGRRVDLLRPRPEDIDILDIAVSLSRLPRFLGHTQKPYSVACHSLSLFHVLRKFDRGRTAQQWGLLHDAHEAYIGDIVRPLFHAFSESARSEIDHMKDRFDAAITARFDLEVKQEDHHLVKLFDADQCRFELKHFHDSDRHLHYLRSPRRGAKQFLHTFFDIFPEEKPSEDVSAFLGGRE